MSKVTQVAVCHDSVSYVLIALRDDGTIWRMRTRGEEKPEWIKLPPLPTEEEA